MCTEYPNKIKLPHRILTHIIDIYWNSHTEHPDILQHIVKHPHRSPIQNLKPIQSMYNLYVFTKVLEKDIHTYHFYQSLVNTSVVIWNVNLKYKSLVFLSKFVR